MTKENPFKELKRSCTLCTTYKNFKPGHSEKEREQVQECLKQLANQFNNKFNALRKEDASGTAIKQAKERKAICLQALDVCQKCDKEFDKANRFLMDNFK